jgi:uncharacterized membrane protein YidH (DUF202 family)
MDEMTQFKNVKKLKSKCLKLKNERSFLNWTLTQIFIIHLFFFKVK